jgi:hypothetical protein
VAENETNASKLIGERIQKLGDWRGETLGKVRGESHALRNTGLVTQRRHLHG